MQIREGKEVGKSSEFDRVKVVGGGGSGFRGISWTSSL